MTIDAPNPCHLPALRQLWITCFGDTEAFVDKFFTTGFSPRRCLCVIAQNQPVAALYWFDCLWQNKKLAYIYGVATAEAYRGQGLCRTLMDHTHRHLQRQGYGGAVLVPAKKSLFPLYEKMGYLPFCPMETVSAEPGNAPAAIRTLTPDDYAALRPGFLPEGSILQTGKTLEFFGTYGKFYAGDAVLFCAETDKDTLYFQEFLGDRDQIPGILTALKAKKGVLRIPGGTAPFAMYRPLTVSSETPSYLGIPLN